MNAAEIENEFNRVKFENAIVNSMITVGCSLEEVIIALHERNQQLLERVVELTLIAPKKYQTPDGKVHLWECPADLIPISRA